MAHPEFNLSMFSPWISLTLTPAPGAGVYTESAALFHGSADRFVQSQAIKSKSVSVRVIRG